MCIKGVSAVTGISAIGCMIALAFGDGVVPGSTATPSGDSGSSGAATLDRDPHSFSPTRPANPCPDPSLACEPGETH